MGVKEEDQLIQENIQEYVHDDSKIVTCKWLSLTLSIPVNSAKIALFQFVSSVRQSGNNDDINVTYFVSGFETKECGTKVLKCAVVPESHLDALKKTMDPVTSCHVYSVQKAKLMDYTPLYQADYDICRENAETLNKFSAISCPWAVLRDDRPVENQTVKDTSAQKTGNKGADVPKSTSLSSTTKSNDDKKGTTGNKKGAGIASMFAAAGKKEKKPDNSAVSKDSKSTTSTSSKAKDSSDKKGIQAMFKGQAKKAEVKDVKTEKKTSPKQAEAPSTKQKSQRKSEKGQKHKLSGSDEPQKRKRRRIRTDLFDSSDEENDKKDDEDDDMDANIDVEMSDQEEIDQPKEEEEKAIEESDNEDEKSEDEKSVKEEKEVDERKTIEKQIVVKDGKRRKRTRKLVPKQHIDEDGFMVTEKVWESDSTDASDEEEAKPTTTTSSKASSSSSPSKSKSGNAAKPTANKKKAAAVSPSKNKQTSLMSFFKKK